MDHEISTCNMMQLTNKRINKTEASCTLEGTLLENVDSIKYLGVLIANDLVWNTHITNICTKANRTLGFLRRNLFLCPQDSSSSKVHALNVILGRADSIHIPTSRTCAPKMLKKQLIKDWCAQSWNMEVLIGILILKTYRRKLEKLQNHAARFVTRNYTFEEGSMTGILEQFK